MTDDNRWIPLESNPEVFNSWAIKAGLVASQAQFEDVYGLDEELLDIVSKPVKAVILLFPEDKEMMAKRVAEDAIIAGGQPKLDETILWIKQTIKNACGTMALIHAVANAGLTIVPRSPLAKFIDQCKDKTPEERAHLLETTPLFANIHTEMAESGQTPVPLDLDTDLHFTCFVQAPDAELRERAGTSVGSSDGASSPVSADPSDSGETEVSSMRLIELDGERAGPIDRGECEDFLKDVADFVRARYVTHSSSMHFSMIALGTPQMDRPFCP